MSKSKTEKEMTNISDMFFSENDNGKLTYDDSDYIVYQELEEAEIVLIPIEEEEKHEKKKLLNFEFKFKAFDAKSLLLFLGKFFTELGENTSAIVSTVFASVFAVIKVPAVFIWQKIILVLGVKAKEKASRSAKRIKLHDYKEFHRDARKAIKTVHKEESFRERQLLFRKNILLSFTKHRRVWLTAVNTGFPVLCLIILVITVSHFSNLTYALKVSYNGEDIGYVANEEVFNKAKDSALERFSSDSADEIKLSVPTYSVTMLTPDKLCDSRTICDKIIEHTDGDFVNACGIYIDGDFVCAVKNETDAISVFDKILEPYAKKAGSSATVAFVQEIGYVQGFYSDNEDVIWDSAKLENEMNSTKSGAVYYTVKQGDSPLSIAREQNISYSKLVKLNPSLAKGNIHVGEKVLLSAQVNNIRVKVMKTESRNVEVPYETETKDSAYLYKGTSKTVQTGKNGSQKITELVTYIDGVKTYATTVSTVTTKYPVKEIIYKGTKEAIRYSPSGGSRYTGGYSGYIQGDPTATGTSFGSPMASSYYISSGYGGRMLYGRYNFHRGIDLCHAGGSSGIPVLSVLPGTVVGVTSSYSGYGYSVLIRHANGIQTRYAHMQAGSISVRVGQSVSKGQQIGRVGRTGNATGPHLHFEVIRNGSCVNPAPYLR